MSFSVVRYWLTAETLFSNVECTLPRSIVIRTPPDTKSAEDIFDEGRSPRIVAQGSHARAVGREDSLTTPLPLLGWLSQRLKIRSIPLTDAAQRRENARLLFCGQILLIGKPVEFLLGGCPESTPAIEFVA